jgi:hypothetical protein
MLSWFTVITLMVEAARVIEMRLRLIALGRGTADEMFLMVTEKIKALEEAGVISRPRTISNPLSMSQFLAHGRC